MASRSLDDLRPDVADAARKLVQACAAEGIDLLVYCTYRSGAEQDVLFAKGRSGVPGEKKVTNARAGESPHNAVGAFGKPAALAFDCVPMDAGAPNWGTQTPELRARWERIGKAGEALGLRWGGRWKFCDLPHFEAADWKRPARKLTA